MSEGADFDWSGLTSNDEGEGPLAAPRTPAGQRRGRRASKTKLDALQAQLSGQMFTAGAMIGLGLPVTGYYTCQESDNFTKAVVQLASNRKEWIEALEHLANLQPGLIVGRTALGFGAAIAVDRGKADPEKHFMRFLGVHAAWLAVNNPAGASEEGSGYRPPPSSFVTVS